MKLLRKFKKKKKVFGGVGAWVRGGGGSGLDGGVRVDVNGEVKLL